MVCFVYHLAAEVDRLEKHAADSVTGWGSPKRCGGGEKHQISQAERGPKWWSSTCFFWCLTRTCMTFIGRPGWNLWKGIGRRIMIRRLWIAGVAKIEFQKYQKIPNDQLDPIVFDGTGKNWIYLIVIDFIDLLNKDEGQSSQDSVKFMNNKNTSFLLLETTQCNTIRSVGLQLISFSKW